MDREASAICAATGLPYVYRTWPAAMLGEIPYPHLRYWRESSERFAADDSTYLMVDTYEVMLVSEVKDEYAESDVEAAFAEAGIVPSNPYELWVPDERLHQVSWSFQLIRDSVPERGETGESAAEGA